VRWATLGTVTLLTALLLLVACNDLRNFAGSWNGPRVGDVDVLRQGPGESATLTIESIDAHGIAGTLAIAGLMPATELQSLPGAEADALANLTFSGNPLRVYLAFVPVPDIGGEALAVISLYDDRRVEVRLIRGGVQPIYAIYALEDR
jgi:hypothetical protein